MRPEKGSRRGSLRVAVRSEAGAVLRKRFPNVNLEVVICASRDATHETVGAAVESMQDAGFIRVGFAIGSRSAPCIKGS